MRYNILQRLTAIVLALLSSLYFDTAWAQIKIGDNSRTLNPNAMLELESKNKGLLLPRLSLQSTSIPDPLKNFEAGMIVYNINTKNDVSPGVYFSDGNKWIKAISPNNFSDSTFLSTLPFLSGAKTIHHIVVSNGQSIFQTPFTIADPDKVFLFRNGVLISFTINGSNTIISELPCNTGDHIRIIQLL